MRYRKVWFPLCLMLATAATAGCASMPGLTSLMPGGTAKPNSSLDSQLSMARLSERQGDTRTAEQIYQAVLTKHPQNQLALHRLGVLAAKASDRDKAAEYFNAAAQLGPPSADLLNDIGFNLYGMGRLQEAEAVFRQAVAADSQNRSARNNLGLVLGETRRYDESLAEFRRAGKGEAEAQSNLAYAQTQAGDVAGANASYHRALTLDMELKPAAEALVQLDRQHQANRNGTSASGIKTLPELARDGRTSNFFESVIERDRAEGRANAGHRSGESVDAVRQAAYTQDTAVASEHDAYPSVSSPSSQTPGVAVGTGGSFVLSRVFRFPIRIESAPTTVIHRRTTADAPAPNSAGRSASRLSDDLPTPAKLADAVAPPPTRPSRWRRATLHQPARSSSPVAPFDTSATRAVDQPQTQLSAAQMRPTDGPATGPGSVFAVPALFPASPSGSAAANPWQTPTWTPDFGAALSPGATAAAPPVEATVAPARLLTNLAP
jgi:Tfp pilus assembly protein PilF